MSKARDTHKRILPVQSSTRLFNCAEPKAADRHGAAPKMSHSERIKALGDLDHALSPRFPMTDLTALIPDIILGELIGYLF
jgi:hypothetical protein